MMHYFKPSSNGIRIYDPERPTDANTLTYIIYLYYDFDPLLDFLLIQLIYKVASL